MEVRCFDSIDKIDKDEWDSIVDDNHILNSYDYLRAIEFSKVNNFYYRYLMFYINNELIAHVPIGILKFNLDVMADQGIRKISAGIRKIFPSFLNVIFIESGFSTALGTGLHFKNKNNLKNILYLFDKELKRIAKEEKTFLILIRDIYPEDKDDFDYLLQLKYQTFQNFPNTFLHIDFNSFNDYLNDLSSKRRHEIKSRLKTFYDNGCSIEKIENFDKIADKLTNLWHNTFVHSKDYQREILNQEYFKFLSLYLDKKSFILLCSKEKKPIGFTMFLDSGDTLISTYCGLDYETNKSCYTYFVLFYKSIEEAIKMKKKWLELGITNYNPKIEIGAIPKPLYIYGKSTSMLLNFILVPLLRITSSTPRFNKRNIFNNRHYDRYKLENYCEFIIDNKKYRINNISKNGVEIIGIDSLKLNKTYDIKIIIKDNFPILAKFKVLNYNILEDGNKRFGLTLKQINENYKIYWNDLIDTFSINNKIEI